MGLPKPTGSGHTSMKARKTGSRKNKPKTHRPTRSTSGRAKRPRGKFALREVLSLGERTIEFPQVKGKTADKIELRTTADYHGISVAFEDDTSIDLEIEPVFIVRAAHSDYSTDKIRTKRWREIRSYRRT
jgi:hypothetical protein